MDSSISSYSYLLEIFLLLLLLTGFDCLKAQKRIIDTSAVRDWSYSVPGPLAISPDGQYLMRMSNKRNNSSLTLEAVDGPWRWSAKNVNWIGFVRNGKKAVIQTAKDTICILTLGSDIKEYLADIEQYLLVDNADSNWFLYLRNSESDGIHLRNLETGSDYQFKDTRNILLRERNHLLASTVAQRDTITLRMIDLDNMKYADIWRGPSSANYTFNKTGECLAFTTPHRVWYFKSGMASAIQIGKDGSDSLKDSWNIQGKLSFGGNNNWLFVNLTRKRIKTMDAEGKVGVDIWSYKDARLQSQQLADTHIVADSFNMGVLSLKIKRDNFIRTVTPIEQSEDQLLSAPDKVSGDYFLVAQREGGIAEDWWNPLSMPAICLVSLVDGSRKILKRRSPAYGGINYHFSPGGRYVIYFDNLGGSQASLQWYSYEISTGITRCLTKDVGRPFNTQSDDYDMPLTKYLPYELVAWVGNDNGLLIRDEYDIWQIDINGRFAPVNLTAGVGRQDKIKFKLFNQENNEIFESGDTLFVKAFYTQNKQSGFFTIKIGRSELKKLTVGPYWFDEPMKAAHASTWLLIRQTATDAPNYFLTNDWHIFKRLTNEQPQLQYNWLTSELINWETIDGRPGQGILYKPENFNPAVKYPVIVHYYEQKSEQLYQFPRPRFTADELNIPYFVSRGYLVFVPDIHYKLKEPGNSAYNYIVSGAQLIRNLPYVNKLAIGLQGHSFGGFETDYIVTHSNLFAAAVSASGWADLIQRYGALLRGSLSGESTTEVARSRIGATLWQSPDTYINNSAIFTANKVRTPLLMMNNKLDDQVPFSLGVEFFTALRRLQKPAWMLQYDGEGHSLSKEINQVDFTIRITQFFDHYLKGAPPPVWMTHGVPAAEKGINSGFDLDLLGNCSVECLICQKKRY